MAIEGKTGLSNLLQTRLKAYRQCAMAKPKSQWKSLASELPKLKTQLLARKIEKDFTAWVKREEH